MRKIMLVFRDPSRGDQDGSAGEGVPKTSGVVRDHRVRYRTASGNVGSSVKIVSRSRRIMI